MNQPLLTVGITTFYGTNPLTFRRLLLSLFDTKSTPTNISEISSAERLYQSYESDTPVACIQDIIAPVEIFVFIDCKEKLDEIVLDIIKIIEDMKSSLNPNVRNKVNFRVMRSVVNVKTSVGRNMVIRFAQGKYMKYCDDDDISINLNELITVIQRSPRNVGYIETYVMNLNKTYSKLPIIATMLPSNVIVETVYLRTYNISFIPDIGEEDTFWRTDLYASLMTNKIVTYMNHTPIYLYCPSSGRSVITRLSAFDDRLEDFDYDVMKDNTKAYRIISKVFRHERMRLGKSKIPINPVLMSILNTYASVGNSWSIIKEYMMQHNDWFDIEDYLNMVSKINGMISFWDIPTDKHKARCFQLFLKYISFPDMFKFAERIADGERSRAVEFMNILWKSKNAYDIFVEFANGIRWKLLDEFTYKYIMIMCVRGDEKLVNLYGTKIDNNLISEIRGFIDEYIKRSSISEVLMYIHWGWSKKNGKMIGESKNKLFHDVINYLGNGNDSKDIVNDIAEILPKKELEACWEAIITYIEMNDIEKYDITVNRKSYVIYMDTFMGLLIAPNVSKGSIDYDIDQDEGELNTIALKEWVSGTNWDKLTAIKGSVKPKANGMYGGVLGGMMTHVDRRTLVMIVMLIVGGVVMLVVVIVIVSLMKPNRTNGNENR